MSEGVLIKSSIEPAQGLLTSELETRLEGRILRKYNAIQAVGR